MIEKVRLLTTQNPHFKGHTPLKAKENNSAATPAISKGISIYEKGSSIKFANSIMFTGLASATERLRQHMVTCYDPLDPSRSEDVGTMYPVSDLADEFYERFLWSGDTSKSTMPILIQRGKDTDVTVTPGRNTIKRLSGGYMMYEMIVRDDEHFNIKRDSKLSKKEDEKFLREYRGYELSNKKTITPRQQMTFIVSPDTKKRAYMLQAKDRWDLMGVVCDGDNVLLTNSGSLSSKDDKDGYMALKATKLGNEFKPFTVKPQPVRQREVKPSIGEGTEIVIGMEDGRFVGELIHSLEKFSKKVEEGKILLDPFVEKPNASKIQLAMLAGGFGSRAEYTNAASTAILLGEEGGTQSTKGVFETATGLTPMETTFITLHKAGLLDCTKLKIGGNVKLYLNKSGVNKGNGGFTVDLYNKMAREGRESLMIFPNDSMSRMTNATDRATNLINTKSAAIAMIAKEVKSEDARGALGIMKLSENGEILEFAEKPKQIPEGYEQNGQCLTNTFQFAVSKEAFEALAEIEPHLLNGVGKETRDWSKLYVPIIMALTQENDLVKIQDKIFDLTKEKDEFGNTVSAAMVPLSAIERAKEHVREQKVYAVRTDEPWADCGTLNALYHTTMQIASGDFPLEDFERAHVLECVDTKTGLVATSKKQKEEIEKNYSIKGQVMAVKQAEKIDTPALLEKYKDVITVNEKVNK